MVPQNILVSDDEPPICELLKIILQGEGYNVLIASNGQEALEIAKKHPLDGAILDIKMPFLNGIEVLKEIKAIDPTIEVIIITGFADFESLGQAMHEYGAFDYLLKPFRGTDIIPILKSALLKREVLLQKKTGKKISQLEKIFQERTRELRESQIKYKEIIENSNDMILVVQKGKIKYANRKTLELTGYPEKKILGLSFIGLIHPEDRPMVQERRISPLDPDKCFTTYSFRVLRKTGESFLVEVNEVKTVWEGSPARLEFIRDISERIHAEQHIRALGQQLMKTQEIERQKLSRELHDRLAQDLSTLKIGLDTLFSDFQDSGVFHEVKKKVSEFSKMLKGSIIAVRDLAYDLRPPSLGHLGIARTFSAYCEEFGEKTGLEIDFYSAGVDELKLDSDIEINLYRLIQEALNNTKKHAEATQIKVRLVASFPNIILNIEDNGKGFNVSDRMVQAYQKKRMGLRSMEERVSLLHGKMNIQSRLQQGTKIFIEVPFSGKSNRSPELTINDRKRRNE